MAKKFSQIIIVIGIIAVASAFAIYFFKTNHRVIDLNAGGYKDFNILLITLDTVRADHLGTYGYHGVQTPNLDRLGSESFVFEDAIAHVPLTLPSHASIMTGRLPIAHGVRDNAGYVLDQNEITLAEALKDEGYTTAAYVSASVLESRWKLDQGFEVYDDYFKNVVSADLSNEVERNAADTEKISSQWIDKNHEKKFFLWVHFYDAHDPYNPPEPYKSAYSDNPYDGEIAYVDDAVGKLLAKLDALQLRQRTIVVVTSDHGEGLGEHHEPTHGVFLYNTTQHVPLFISVPGAEGKRISGTVSHIDLAPTIVQLIGAKDPSKMQGKSLISKMNGNDNEQRSVYSESLYAQLHYGWSKLESVTTDQYRYINSPKPELFDRKADKAESNNILQQKTSIAKVLNSKLTEIIQQFSTVNLAGPQKIDPETEEKLRALGYIGTTVSSTEESRKVDPKDKAEVILQIQEASGLLGQQKFAQALEKALPVLQQDSGMIDAHYVAGAAYLQLGKFDEAVTELRKTLELNPQDTRAMYNLAFAFELMKQPKDAEFWYLKALQLNPENTLSTLKLAHLYRNLNQIDKSKQYFENAAAHYQKALANADQDRVKAEIHLILAELNIGSGKVEEGKENYKAAINLAKNDLTISGDCFLKLGLLYHANGEYENEMKTFQEMIQYKANDPRGYFYLAKVLLDRKGNMNDVIALAQKGLSLNPPADLQVFGHYLLGNAYHLSGRSEESRKEFTLAEELERSLRSNSPSKQ